MFEDIDKEVQQERLKKRKQENWKDINNKNEDNLIEKLSNLETTNKKINNNDKIL